MKDSGLDYKLKLNRPQSTKALINRSYLMDKAMQEDNKTQFNPKKE